MGYGSWHHVMLKEISRFIILITLYVGGCVPIQPGNVRSEESLQTILDLRQQVRDLQERNKTLSEKLSSVEGIRFVLHTDNNEQTTKDFAIFLKQNAFDVTRYGSTTLLVKYNNGIFAIEPKAKQGGLSRVIVSKTYNVKQQYRRTIDVFTYVIELNQKLNFANFYLSNDFSTLIVRGNITFVDQLEEREIRKFLEHFDVGILAILIMVPDTTKYID